MFLNRDYRAIPALDRYDGGELDESDYDAISESGRREAERAMRKRDQEMGVGDMRRGLFYGKFSLKIVLALIQINFYWQMRVTKMMIVGRQENADWQNGLLKEWKWKMIRFEEKL